MSSKIVIVLLLFFQFEYFLFLCLIALTRTSNTMLIKVVRVGILVLFLILEGKFSVFHYMILGVGLIYMAFIMLKYILFMSTVEF